ncbi:MAG: relaxase/mobilization nuclease domain-containing protein [Flammeovirgaceae bacterium]
MIIKSIRWKRENKFAFLVKYVDKEIEQNRDSQTFSICHNFGGCKHFRAVVDEFERNDTHRKKRKNGVVLYHEVLSFSKLDRGNITLEMLEDIAERYITLRAENALVYARPHFDQDHPHIHFIVSGNEVNSKKVTRLNNQAYKQIRLEMERYQLEKYKKELENSFVYLNNWEQKRDLTKSKIQTVSDKEYQIKKRGKQTHKERIALLVKSSFDIAYQWDHFITLLSEDDIAVYHRNGKVTGIKFNNQKFKFATLGIDEEMLKELQHRTLESQTKFQRLQEVQAKNRNLEREIGNDRLLELARIREKEKTDGKPDKSRG